MARQASGHGFVMKGLLVEMLILQTSQFGRDTQVCQTGHQI
jgi:hypothetical protein